MTAFRLIETPRSARLRIALVAPPWLPVPPLGYGGTERVISLLADGLVEQGHDVTLYAAAGSVTTARLVTPLPVPPRLIGSAPDDDVFHTVQAFLADGEFDIIHDHTSLGPAFAALMPDGPPVVHTLHGPWTPGVRRKLGLLHERVHLVAISHSQKSMNPDVRYAGVVHNGVDIHTHPFCADKEDFLVFLGRSNREKAPELAIDVAQAAGLPLTMIVKRSEPAEWEYWNDVVEPRLDGSITVMEQPPHATKVDLLGRARALMCPIDWPEPFGLVFAEALACGTPVITRPLGAAPEIVVHGVSGFLCDTPQQMLDAVEQAKHLSPAACRRRVTEHFSGSAMVRGYEEVYAEVIASRAARITTRPSAPVTVTAPSSAAMVS